MLGELNLGAANGKEHKQALLGVLPQGKAWLGKNLRALLGAGGNRIRLAERTGLGHLPRQSGGEVSHTRCAFSGAKTSKARLYSRMKQALPCGNHHKVFCGAHTHARTKCSPKSNW